MSSETFQPIEDHEEYRDHLATVDQHGKRIWLYPKKPKGPFYNARTWVSVAFVAVFLTLPFIKVGGDPIFMLNILERRFIIFGLVFTPQDFVVFGLLMITFLVFIILFTIVYGRLFCGWVCPQTVFMEMIFRKIEYWIEGDANQQRKLDAAPWTSEKIQKKALKHLIFFAIAVVVANYFLAYIIGMDAVLKIIREPIGQNMGGFGAMVLFSGIFYGVFARLREQVCTTICPYGRLQGVLLVKESIVIAYDYVRGEPRGKLKKSERQTADSRRQTAGGGGPDIQNTASAQPKQPEKCACDDCTGDGKCAANKHLRSLTMLETMAAKATSLDASATFSLAAAAAPAAPSVGNRPPSTVLGDCVDCKLCIAVCPTGIDIRNGTQLECVNCTACIDACDEVMDKVGRPRGLIRYDSMAGIEKGERQIFTTRVKAYSAVLLALMLIDVALLVGRKPMETIILRSPGQLYQQVDEAHVSNLYTYQIINKTNHAMPVQLRLATPGGSVQFVAAEPTEVKKDSLAQGAFFVKMETSALKSRKTPIVIEVFSGGEKVDEVKTNFMGPK